MKIAVGKWHQRETVPDYIQDAYIPEFSQEEQGSLQEHYCVVMSKDSPQTVIEANKFKQMFGNLGKAYTR